MEGLIFGILRYITRQAIGSSENFTTAPDSSPDPNVPGLAPTNGKIKNGHRERKQIPGIDKVSDIYFKIL